MKVLHPAFALTVLTMVGGVAGLHEIVPYTVQSSWNNAIGGTASWCVNFNYLSGDSKISTVAPGSSYQDAGGAIRLRIQGTPTSSDIDNPAVNGILSNSEGSIDGSTYASLYVDRDSATFVRMTFVNSNNIRAWSASYKGVDTERVLADIVSTSSNAVITEELTASGTGNRFYGFTINENLQSITFRAKNPDGSTNSGEVFSMDNICVFMPSSPTPPTSTPAPMPTPPTGDNDDDGCNINIFIIGWLICLIIDIINFIF